MKRGITLALKRRVRRSAGDTCEYCRLHQKALDLTFPVDHIVALQHGGKTRLDNLALCCGFCNRHKGPNISGIDPLTSKVTRLFNPRTDRWEAHFRWHKQKLVGRTAIGRVTVIVLAMNEPRQLAIRRALADESRFPAS